MSNKGIAIEIIDYRRKPQEDFRSILARMSSGDEDYFFLCSSEAALKGDLAEKLREHTLEENALIMPTVVHVLRGKRRLLPHPEFLYAIAGKLFNAEIVKKLLDAQSFDNEIDFMAEYYMQYSNIVILDDVFYYEPSQDVIGRPVNPKRFHSFLISLRLFPENIQKDILRKWVKTAKSRVERECMFMRIMKEFKDQSGICEEFGIYHRISGKLRRR